MPTEYASFAFITPDVDENSPAAIQSMRRIICCGLFLAALLLVSAPATAQDKGTRFEITPFVALRTGGTFKEQGGNGRVELNDSRAEGLMVNIKANPDGQFELLYARQGADADTQGFLVNDPTIDIDVEHLHFGGTYLFDSETVRPFVALTLGASRFDPTLPGANSESFFSASFGGGVQLFPRKRFGVRLEARAFTTFVDDDSSIFCSSINGASGCLIQVDARTLTQWEARAGLVFRF